MARTRAQRRRHTLLITLALVVTLVVLVFARDVSRSAHGSISALRSENRSFAALANALITQENQFDSRLERLLSEGSTLKRVVFVARMNQLNDVLPAWAVDADHLRRPTLAHHVNDELYSLTQERVAAYQTLLADVAHTLSVPWSTSPDVAVTNPSATLLATGELWNSERFALAKEPGLVHLDATSSTSARYFAANGVAALVQSQSLALVRAISIAAVRVTPSPLPAPGGEILLPPVGTVTFGISVLNASYDVQPVTLIIRVTPLNHRGLALRQVMHATLGPLQATAFVPRSLSTAASEQARVDIRVTGARAAVGTVTFESYRLKMSPSGN